MKHILAKVKDSDEDGGEKVPALFLASFLLLAVPVPYVTPSITTEAPKGSLGFSGQTKQYYYT